jgi:hypothetical protein
MGNRAAAYHTDDCKPEIAVDEGAETVVREGPRRLEGNCMTKPVDKAEEARQWALTNRLVSVAIALAAIVAMMLARRYL